MTLEATLSEWATHLGTTRDTLRKRLVEAGATASGKRGGHPVYTLSVVLRAVLSGAGADPFRRRAERQSELLEMKLAVERGELIPRDEVRETFAEAFKPIRQTLETLPDILERDAALTPQQVAACEKAIDKLREELHQQVTGERHARPRS